VTPSGGHLEPIVMHESRQKLANSVDVQNLYCYACQACSMVMCTQMSCWQAYLSVDGLPYDLGTSSWHVMYLELYVDACNVENR
jgi:hypothetical protein